MIAAAVIAAACAGTPHRPYVGRSRTGETVDGRREGGWTFLDHTYDRRVEGTYRAGRRHGTWTLYDDGRRRWEGHYTDGVADGRFRAWTDSGALLGEVHLVRGTGRWTTWISLAPDRAPTVVESGDCVDGLAHGAWTSLSTTAHFDHGVPTGHWRIRDEVGVTEGSFANGLAEGPWVVAAPAYWEMLTSELVARRLPHVPRDDEHLAEPDRFFRGDYRAGHRVGTWTITPAEGAQLPPDYRAGPRTIEYGDGDPGVPAQGFLGSFSTKAPVRCPVPHDERGWPSELAYGFP
jgi:hypothetical protein